MRVESHPAQLLLQFFLIVSGKNIRFTDFSITPEPFSESKVTLAIDCSSDIRCIAPSELAVSRWVTPDSFHGCHPAFLPVDMLICCRTSSVRDCSSPVAGGSFTLFLTSCMQASFYQGPYLCWVILLPLDCLTWSCTEFLADIKMWMCLKVVFISSLPLKLVFDPFHWRSTFHLPDFPAFPIWTWPPSSSSSFYHWPL